MNEPAGRGRLDGLLQRARSVVGSAPVAAAQRILTRYDAGGGGLLAGGLAYAALFALVPAVLLVTGVAGILIADPAARSSAVNTIASVLPPLRELATNVLDEATRTAAPVSILGVIALIWGASRFAVALQDAIARVMGGTRRRSFLVTNLGGIGAIALLVVAILASPLIAGISAFLDAGEATGIIAVVGQGLGVALALVPLVIAIAAVAIVYRLVPVLAPRWRSLLLPAVTVGIVLTLLARIFVFLSPRLIGAAALLGTIASVFAALAWLSLSFQALLLGAAWTAERDQPPVEASISPEAPPPA